MDNYKKLVLEDYAAVHQVYNERYNDSKEFPLLFEAFNQALSQGSKVVDIGCAGGHTTKALASRFDVTGVDISPEMIALAKNQYPEVEFVHADMNKLSFGSGVIDGIWAARSIIHIPPELIGETIKEFSRVLKPKGILALVYVAEKDIEYSEKTSEEYLVEDPKIKYYLVKYNPGFINKLAEMNGFKLISTFEELDRDGDEMTEVLFEKL